MIHPTAQHDIESIEGRPACILSHPSTTLILQLEARPLSRSHRCLHSELEPASGLCQSSLVPDITTLAKIQWEKAKIVLVSPLWRSQPWYPILLQLLEGFPLIIPIQKNIVISPTQQEFIMPSGVPQLVVWPLSGVPADRKAFQQRLHNYWKLHGEARQLQSMNPSSNSRIVGVRNGIGIPLGVM